MQSSQAAMPIAVQQHVPIAQPPVKMEAAEPTPTSTAQLPAAPQLMQQPLLQQQQQQQRQQQQQQQPMAFQVNMDERGLLVLTTPDPIKDRHRWFESSLKQYDISVGRIPPPSYLLMYVIRKIVSINNILPICNCVYEGN